MKWWSTHANELQLFENDDEIVLRRHSHIVLLSVQLTHNFPNHSNLENWLRLGHSSLNHFQGALSQAPSTGALWLIQSVPAEQGETVVFSRLEALLNQRDTWRTTISRLGRPAQPLKPTSLRSLSS